MVQISKAKTVIDSRSRHTRIILFCSVILIGTLVHFQNKTSSSTTSETPAATINTTIVRMTSAMHIQATHKPHLIYGTAWKEDNTSHLVSQAVHAGFRFIDTACQPKHYNEPQVGQGWSEAAKELGLSREDFFIQTKFTPLSGQDMNRLPYNKDSSLVEQVEESLQVSLKNLVTTYLDSLVLHSPYRNFEDTLAVWNVMESFVDSGKVKQIGISNCYDFHKFQQLYDSARIKPSFLQNRFYEESGFDMELRKFCKEKGILYQSFWTLTANRHALATPEIKQLAREKSLTPQTLMYAYMMTLGHTPLSGSTNVDHMREDVAVMERIQGGEVILNDDEMARMTLLLGIPSMI